MSRESHLLAACHAESSEASLAPCHAEGSEASPCHKRCFVALGMTDLKSLSSFCNVPPRRFFAILRMTGRRRAVQKPTCASGKPAPTETMIGALFCSSL